MKRDLTIIYLALRAAIIITTVWAIIHITTAKNIISYDDPNVVKDALSEYFSPTEGWAVYASDKTEAAAFCIVYALLIVYLIYGIIRFYRCITKIENGKMFYTTQGEEFRKAANNIIGFAKLKYLLFCGVGMLYFFDLEILFRQLPSFIAIYLLGKLILLMSYMTQTGEFVKQENELTI